MACNRYLELVDNDDCHQKMKVYINHKDKLFITVGQLECDDILYTGYITLAKNDVSELIKELQFLEEQM